MRKTEIDTHTEREFTRNRLPYGGPRTKLN
jgi:hypothetical protein